MKNVTKFLTRQFKTGCPYTIAKKNGIHIILEPLGNIQGYYNQISNQKFIHVNSDLSDWFQTFVVACQLFYALQNMEYRFMTIGNCDVKSDAYKFAATLLYYDYHEQGKPKHDYSLVMA